MQQEFIRINKFIKKVTPHLFRDDSDINEIVDAYSDVLNLSERLHYYATQEFKYRSDEHSLQYDLRTALHYSVAQLLKNESDSTRDLLHTILETIPAILLIGYPLELVVRSHHGYFLPHLEAELTACLKNEIANRERMGLNSYITYPSAEKLLQLCPDIALRVLPLIFQNDWDSGFRMAFAKALYTFGDRSEWVVRYYGLLNKDFSDPFFHGPQCFDIVKKTIEHFINARTIVALPEEIEPLETLLNTIALKFSTPEITEFLNNKWHGDNWHKRTVELANGWRFKFERAPYIEKTRLVIDGGEQSRDNFVASYPAQKEWLHKTLGNSSLGTYSSSWVIDFYITGNALLKYLLSEIEALDKVTEDAMIPPREKTI